MNKNEVFIIENDVGSENGVISVNIDDIPKIVSESIEYISKLEKEVENSEVSAQKAMKYVNSQMTRYEETGKWIFKHRSGNTKEIIEDTQEAIEQLAEAQQVSTVALRRSFDFQKQLAETSKYLFQLGCANIVVNRTAVQAIEKKLNGATNEEISELAYQEMENVILQLKNQEDILIRQENLTTQVIENTDRLDKVEVIDKNQTEKIEALGKENREQNKKLLDITSSLSEKDRIDAVQTQRLEELSALLDNKGSIDQKQEEAISGLKSELKEKSLLDNDQSKRIENNEKSIQIIHDFIKQKDILDKKQSAEIMQIKKGSNLLSIIAIIISSVSLVCNIVLYFLK